MLKPPVIHQVQRRDTKILMEASDHVIVLVITILDDEGKLLEKGAAARQESLSTGFGGKTITAEA